MAEVRIVFEVPVVVTVDLENHDVTRVNVADETSGPWLEGYDEAYNKPKGGQVRRAIEIAGDAMWPAWEFGW